MNSPNEPQPTPDWVPDSHHRNTPSVSLSATRQRGALERYAAMPIKDKLTRDVPANGSPCSVGRALKGLPPEELELFEDLLGTPERPGKAAAYIYDLMQAERRDLYFAASRENEAGNRPGAAALQDLAEIYNVGNQTINRHRGRKCRCFKDAA